MSFSSGFRVPPADILPYRASHAQTSLCHGRVRWPDIGPRLRMPVGERFTCVPWLLRICQPSSYSLPSSPTLKTVLIESFFNFFFTKSYRVKQALGTAVFIHLLTSRHLSSQSSCGLYGQKLQN